MSVYLPDGPLVRYLCVIPARGGSKGIPIKNLRPLAGKPLIVWTIEHAIESERLDRVIVSTDDDEIARIAGRAGADVPFRRPAELASDEASSELAAIHALSELERTGYRPDALIMLQATSPVRRPRAIDRAIEQFESSGADSLLTVSPIGPFIWRHRRQPESLYDYRGRLRRQEVPEDDCYYRENGSMYVTRTTLLREEGNRLGGKIALHVMTNIEGIDIDDEADFLMAESVFQAQRSSGR